MDKTASRNNIRSFILTASVIIALLVISIIQYKWVITSSEQDLNELYRNMNFRMYRSFSAKLESELQSYNELFFYDYKSEDELKQKTEQMVDRYISSISYTKENTLYTFNGSTWIKIMQNSDVTQRMGDLIPIENGRVKVILPIKSLTNTLFIFNFDMERYFKENIKSDILTDEYELVWYFTPPKDSNIINEFEYKYSPFKFIKNRLLGIDEKWLLGVSFNLDLRREKKDGSPILFIKPKVPNQDEKQSNLYIDILVNGKSLIRSKESYITFQWLLTLLLLVGMGISYIYILNQIRSLRNLRTREKIFVATVTHELRTPLTVIHSAADNLEKGFLKPEKLTQYGGLIKDQTRRLTSMVEGILLFSRLEGKVEKPPILTTLNLQELVEDFKNLDSELIIDCSLSLTIQSDKETIMHILSNLISNARKHGYNSNKGTIRVKIHIMLPKKIIFTVEDDGKGIAKKDIKSIFKPFYRSKNSYDEQIKGSGLGLFIAYSKTKLLNGDILVESPYERTNGEIKSGSRFTVSLPYISLINGDKNE